MRKTKVVSKIFSLAAILVTFMLVIDGQAKSSAQSIKLETMLPKNNFKLFEPIFVKFKYINLGSENDSVFQLFRALNHNMKFLITDANGNIYENKVIPHLTERIEPPDYIVKPNDTLITVMNFNLFGKEAGYPDNYYFMEAYFPVGKYSGYAYFDKKGQTIKSNTIDFEISEPDSKDIEVLSLFKQGSLNEILLNYDNSPYTEFIWITKKVGDVLYNYDKRQATADDLIRAYKGFFDKYPNSLYNFYYLPQYISLVTNFNVSAVSDSISELVVQYPDSFISDYLSNHHTQDLLSKIVRRQSFKR